MDVVFSVGRQIVVNDERDLLDIDTTSQKIGGDQDSGRTSSELSHNLFSVLLVHVSVHARDGEISSVELLGEPFDLLSGVQEDDTLGDGDGLVKIAQSFELPVFFFNVDVILFDTFKGKFFFLDQNSDWFSHESLGDIENFSWHGGGQKHDLDVSRKSSENIVNLVLETSRKHLIGLIENEDLDVSGVDDLSGDHIEYTTGSSDDDLLRIGLESLNFDFHVVATNTSVTGGAHVVTKGENDLLDLLGQFTGGAEDESLSARSVDVDLLEARDGEGGGFTGTGLGLRDDVVALGAWNDSSHLDGGRLLETIRVDTSEELLVEGHVVEGLADFVPVGLDQTVWVHAFGAALVAHHSHFSLFSALSWLFFASRFLSSRLVVPSSVVVSGSIVVAGSVIISFTSVVVSVIRSTIIISVVRAHLSVRQSKSDSKMG